MPAEAVPFVCAVVVAFSAFILAVGGAAIWTGLPVRSRSRKLR
mgnify:CR=1 FL=1